jgi:hypothetical protein
MLPELETCLSVLEQVHELAARELEGLPPEALNWRPTEGEVGREDADPEATNSLAGLVMHIAGSERYLIGQIAGGRGFDRDRAGEFLATGENVESLQRVLRHANAYAREVMDPLTLEQLEEMVPSFMGPMPRRWALLRAVAHAGLHAGHMQLTRQLYLLR